MSNVEELFTIIQSSSKSKDWIIDQGYSLLFWEYEGGQYTNLSAIRKAASSHLASLAQRESISGHILEIESWQSVERFCHATGKPTSDYSGIFSRQGYIVVYSAEVAAIAIYSRVNNLPKKERDRAYEALESFDDGQELAFAHGQHPNSMANLRPHPEHLNPRANDKGGRKRVSVMLSDDAIKGAEMLAKKLGYLRNGKPNRSEAINYSLKAVHWIMEYGGQFTMSENGMLHLKNEKDASPDL